jgi:hypothetical protein
VNENAPSREEGLRAFLDQMALATEHRDITNAQAVREICESAIAVYDGTENQYVADWACDVIRGLDERGI